MGTRPGRSARSARTRWFAGLAALVLCVALVDVPAAWAKSTPVDSVASTSPKAGTGTVTKTGRKYEICVPYFTKGVAHSYEIKNGDTVVDTFTYTVPATDGTVETITTDKGVDIEITTTHTGGVNGSPSKGCFTYKPPKKPKK
jgi:hypothetical protein